MKLPATSNYYIFGIILFLITIFRRRLSSNDEYRGKPLKWRPLRNLYLYLRSKTCVKSVFRYISDRLSRMLLFLNTIILNDMTYECKHEFRGGNDSSASYHCDDHVATLKPMAPTVTLQLSSLPLDVIILVSLYVGDCKEILAMSTLCRNLHAVITSESLWEQLWLTNYGDMWRHPNIVSVRVARRILWDPRNNYGPPQQGWFLFYVNFEHDWMDWMLAGACSSDLCLIGLYGSLLDITSFIHSHPGSPESLMEAAGCDATLAFNDIGHSIHALSLLDNFTIWKPRVEQLFMNNNHSSQAISEDDEVLEPSHVTPSTWQHPSLIQVSEFLHNDRLRRQNKSKYGAMMLKQRNLVLKIASDFNALDSATIASYLSSCTNKSMSSSTSSHRSSNDHSSSSGSSSSNGTISEEVALVRDVDTLTFLSVLADKVGGVGDCDLPNHMLLSRKSLDSSARMNPDSLPTPTDGEVDPSAFSDTTLANAIDNSNSISSSYSSDSSYSDKVPSSSRTDTASDGADVDSILMLQQIPARFLTSSDSLHSLRILPSGYSHCFHATSGKPRVDFALRRMLPDKRAFFDCFPAAAAAGDVFYDRCYEVKHFGQPKACYDPLEMTWVVWWTCCSSGSFVSLDA